MKIDIRNIFGSGSGGRSVDVKQVMESEAEQLEADVSLEAAQTDQEANEDVSDDISAKKADNERKADAGNETKADAENEPKADAEAERMDEADTDSALKSAPALDERIELEQTTEADGSLGPGDQPDSHAESEGDSAPNSDSELENASSKTDGQSEAEQEGEDASSEDGKASEPGGQPDSAAHQADESEKQAVGSDDQQTVDDDQRTSDPDSQQMDGDGQPDSAAHQAAESEKQAVDSDDQQTADDGQRTADAQQTTDEAHPGSGDQPASAPDEKQAGDNEKQAASDAQAGSDAQQAGDEDREATDEIPETAGEAAATPKQPLPIKEKFLAICRRYGWCTGIAAAFAILLAVTLIYTTLTPREVYATINGKEFNFTTKEYTVEEFLEDEKIAFCKEDYISLPLTTYIYDGLKLEINHATDFEVTADGKTKKYKTLDNTVQEALDDIGIKLREQDIVTPSLDTFMTQGLHIVVQRVEVTQEVVEEAIPFQTVTRDDSSLREGTTKVATQGQEGKDQVTYEVTYIDGVEASRTEIARQTVTAAVDEVIAKGTRIDYNGKTYSRKLVVKAYAYTGGGRTAMGTRARVGEIAVDRSVIPLGTNVYIEGVGSRRAEDTGGNIKGNTIDIYMDSEAECRRWGVRYVTIYIQ